MTDALSAKRLLVVDDEPDFCWIVQEMAENLGFTVEVATTGTAFMTSYVLFQPTVVVMDIVMPEIEGVELTQWLIEQDFAGKLILATGYAPNYAAVAQRLAEASAQFESLTLLKPFRVDDFEAALQES